MAVYDQGYRVYRGALTAAQWRFMVLAKYALQDVIKSRRTLVTLVLSIVAPLIAAVMIYIHHNAEALAILRLPIEELVPIDGRFFLFILKAQFAAAFFLFLGAGTKLISVDLRDNALPLYLGRPLSQAEYLLGKLTVLLVLGSAVTWVPMGLLFGLQGILEGFSWVMANLRLGLGIFAGSWVVLLLYGLVALAISAALRAKAAAEASFVGIFILGALFGQVMNETLDTEKGVLFNVFTLIDSVVRALMGITPSKEVGPLAAALALGTLGAVAVVVLRRRVRAYEVVE